MKTTMKKSIAYLLAVLLVFQIVPVFAGTVTGTYAPRVVIFREKLEITPAERVSIMPVGMKNQLTINEGYDKIVWSSDNENVATVDENGLVEAVGAGKVKITVSAEDGHYSDSITFKVTGPAASENNNEEQLVIIVSGDKTKTVYDGQVHTNTYSVASNKEYDASKLTVNQEGLASGIDCKTYKDELTATYDGDAEVIVSNGWLQIKPKTITIKADDIVVDEGVNPSYTATVTEGLVAGETLDLSEIEFTEIEQNGNTYIQPNIQKGQVFGNYRVENVLSGILTVNKAENSQRLYNFLKMDSDNNYYRLKITSINADPYEKIGSGKTLNADQYTIPSGEYDFSKLILTVGDEEYKFSATQPEGDFESCYTIDSVKVTTNNRITGQDAWFNNPAGYLDDSEAQYKSMGIKRTQAGFHRDYFVKLHKGKKITHEEPVEEPVEEPDEEPMSIRVKSSWPKDTPAYAGTQITLTAELIGFEGKEYTLQWQHSTDHENWVDEPGATGTSFTYELNIETTEYYWRVVAIDAE